MCISIWPLCHYVEREIVVFHPNFPVVPRYFSQLLGEAGYCRCETYWEFPLAKGSYSTNVMSPPGAA